MRATKRLHCLEAQLANQHAPAGAATATPPATNRQQLIASVPKGPLAEENFALASTAAPGPPAEGEVLVQVPRPGWRHLPPRTL